MFFQTDDLSLTILSVLEIDTENNSGSSTDRPYHALSFRIDSNATFLHAGETTVAKTGDILFVPQHYKYTLKTDREHLIVVHFSSEADLPKRIKKFTPADQGYFARKFEELYGVWLKKPFGYQHECKSILFRILAKIERENAKVKSADGADKILEAVEYIHENFTTESISVEHLAKMCGMSDTYFRRLFVQRLHMTPLKYIHKLKLEYALELLKSGYYSVSEVAEKAGFDTPNYFATFIKEKTGYFPSKFIK